MRQGQQNRRGRGRNNNQNNNQQRKGQNPLTRSFESNGPDVKLRGTPAHIAEKYMSLARDAQSSGDPVLAENYLQHAEHYNRIIMAYREQQVSQGGADPGYNGNFTPQRTEGGYGSDESDEGFEGSGDASPVGARQFNGEQPRFPEEGGGERRYDDRPQRTHEPRHQHQSRDRDRPYQGDRGGFRDRNERGDRSDRQNHYNRNDRPDRQDRSDRPDRFDRQDRGDRPDRNEPRGDRDRGPDRPERPERTDRPERFERPQQPPLATEARSVEPRAEGINPPRRRDRPAGDRLPAETHEQPEFLRRPVRRPRREDQDEAVASAPAPAIVTSDDSE